jgi:hypothetical protein
VGAVWELPAKQHSQSSPFPLKLGWISSAIYQIPNYQIFFQILRIFFFFISFKNPQTTIAIKFLTHIISCIGYVPWPAWSGNNIF